MYVNTRAPAWNKESATTNKLPQCYEYSSAKKVSSIQHVPKIADADYTLGRAVSKKWGMGI